MSGERDLDDFKGAPGALGPELAAATAESVTASLHLGDRDVLWLRVEYEGGVFFEPIGSAIVVAGRIRDRGPFFVTGSFARYPRGVRRVAVEYGDDRIEGLTSDAGWLCLVPSAGEGRPVLVRWLDDEDKEYEAIEHPPLDAFGTLGPTFYGPRRRGRYER